MNYQKKILDQIEETGFFYLLPDSPEGLYEACANLENEGDIERVDGNQVFGGPDISSEEAQECVRHYVTFGNPKDFHFKLVEVVRKNGIPYSYHYTLVSEVMKFEREFVTER